MRKKHMLSPSMITSEDTEKLWSNVDIQGPDDCWEWEGPGTPSEIIRPGVIIGGYGQMWLPKVYRSEYAHRVALVSESGRTVPAGMLVMHHCDNPPCCNPSHLRIGTYSDNAMDRERKGRRTYARVSVSRAQANEIIRTRKEEFLFLYRRRMPVDDLARHFDVTKVAIRKIMQDLNLSKREGGISKYRGVSYLKDRGMWRVGITVEGRTRFVGIFLKEKEAAAAYDLACIRLGRPPYNVLIDESIGSL